MLNITNEDNMQLMARYPDNYFDLAIVDPPYGINANNLNMESHMNNKKCKNGWTKKPATYKKGDWDKAGPDDKYFNELFRVSKKQIIWGGNHFDLGPSKGYIIWDKLIGFDFSLSQCELAWTNVITNVKKFTYQWCGFVQGPNGNARETRIHPTQKPVSLYSWLLKNYAKPNDKILDTHLGSGSIAIACHDYGYDLTACELDKEYFDKAMQRIENHTNQTKLFL